MLKVLSVIVSLGISLSATAQMLTLDSDQQLAFDKAVCGSIAENYARGELIDRGMTVHTTRADVHGFMAGNSIPNIYMVNVSTMILTDVALIGKGPDVAYSCYRCPNLKLVVSQERSSEACKNEKL